MRGNRIDPDSARPGRRRWWRAVLATAATIALATGLTVPAAARDVGGQISADAPTAGARAHTVTLDGYSFLVDGRRTYLWSGEFHYFRLPSPDLWRDIFQKMKAAGFNSTSLYFDWGYHSPKPGVYDFTGVRDVDKLLDMAEEAGLYVIARPAPYINAEVDSGGLPGWLTTKAENNRSDDPRFLKYADEWLTQIDRIIARHQLTNGTGSVIAYQVENEYYNGSDAGRSYMKHLEDKARADGITVPLTGNHNGTFNSGTGALDVDGPDSYPQGFNCSTPEKWNGVPDISYDHPAGKPLYSPEFQGGAFDPWGGPGYDKCAQLINDKFANVFYKQNIAVGATAQSFYMTYGGTNWGWLGMPQNYTSYDYGAAIRENRQLDPKYDEDKLIGYFTQSVAPLTKTEAIRATPPDNSAVVDTARMNPDTRTQFHVLRHGDSTSNAVDKTHISLDFNAQPAADTTYTWDDPDSALQYTGSWSHVADQSYTGGDYKHTESFSNKAGDSVTVPFDGTAIRWIGSKTNNHGYADVYLDGEKAATVDDSGSENQAVIFQKTGLKPGAHTLKIVVAGTHSSSSTDSYVAIDAIDVPTADTAEPTYPVVPQQPDTAITLDGRDSHVIVANYPLGDSQLRYSTSEIMTDATIGNRDIAVLYGDRGSDGETVLRYPSKPTVTVNDGTAATTWDPATGDLRLNYTHKGLTRISISGGGHRPLLLLVGDKDTAKTFWRQDTASGPVLVRGTHLLRTATSRDGGRTMALTGDNADDKNIEVFTSAARVTWNGRTLNSRTSATGSRTATIPVAAPVHLPALADWQHADESPEAAPGFDDTSWQVADRTTTNSVSGITSQPVLYADDYGFHTGNTWYRGRFRATGKETGIHLVSDSGGGAQAFSAWLNGTFLGSSTTGSADLKFPDGSLNSKGDNVLSVLTVNMGHEEDYNSTNGNKTARGLTSASLVGAPLTSVTWRLQGVRGGEDLQDTVRGPLSTGGLYGERAGWSLPGYPDSNWKQVSLPTTDSRAGVSWYRTDAHLDLPHGQDTSLGLTFTDDPSRKYRATIFVNGWQVGNYVNYLGPQHTFPVPNGILNPNGHNSIAIAMWNLDGSTGGLGKVSLTNYGSYASSLRVAQNDSPRYDPHKYAMPERPGTEVTLEVPDTAQSGQSFTARTTVRVPKDRQPASRLTASLSAPDGWSVSAPSPASVERLQPGQSATFTWKVAPPDGTLPSASALTTTVHYRQNGRKATAGDERIVGGIPPAPPAGKSAVSDLPFLSSSNGWGPVERDSSVGEQAAGDGHEITIAGAEHAKGLGTNSVSDVVLYLAGNCSRFTADVGVDDETGGAGTVTFSVIADGKTLVTTPTIRGKQTAVPLDVDISGAQVIDLKVGDAGDGNGNDHGDWGTPTLTCG
ncbi:beta-galactosidase [Streptomyces spinosisporus]|uniref:beta-galactosidase n=1 Tax=Streptomyces spinosisporus TaxID=2927582 RepID=A0ABS9XQB6_9ACTN|nr:beta-galactosidase [Streptomyces spinosisporus]MCI3244231.1 beta-galactosidase [Streptomyces spinosisporus]